MATTDITSLRKAGRLDEAYQLAKEAFDSQPDNIWNRRALAWVIYDYAKRNAISGSENRFLKCLEQLISLEMPQDEQVFHDAVGWLVRGMVATSVRAKNEDWGFYDRMLSLVRQFYLSKPSEMYSALLLTVLRIKNNWPGFVEFCNWWGLENLADNDYKPSSTEDGQKLLSLAERAYMAYAKAILSVGAHNDIIGFLPSLSKIATKHHEYIYLPYYQAKLLIKIEHNSEAIKVIKPFARRKASEFWVWELLGDAIDDKQKKLTLYAKALTCRSKIEMTVNLRESMAMLLLECGFTKEAKTEIDNVVKIREKNGWSIPRRIIEQQNATWYANTGKLTDNNSMYHKLSNGAEELVFGPSASKTEYKGKIKISEAGYGFVNFGNGMTVFIVAQLIEKHDIKNGDLVCGLAEKSLDKKKNKMGLKAVNISKCK